MIFCPPKEKEWLSIIASVKFTEGCTLVFPLDGIIEDFLCYGPKIVDIIDRSLSHKKIIVSEWTSTFPTGGFHIDVPERTFDYWLADDAPGLLMRLKEKWHGWKVNWHIDCFERHVEKANGRIVFQNRSLEEMVDNLRDIILLKEDDDPANTILKLAERISNQGQSVQINSFALSNPKCKLEKKTREEIFESAIQALIRKLK